MSVPRHCDLCSFRAVLIRADGSATCRDHLNAAEKVELAEIDSIYDEADKQITEAMATRAGEMFRYCSEAEAEAFVNGWPPPPR